MLITLLDLSRHTDRELSFKSKKLFKIMGGDTYVAKQLASSSQSDRNSAAQILFRMEKTEATEVLKSAGAQQKPQLSRIYEQVESGQKSVTLKPSGSVKGDRYYVKAIWDPNNKSVMECLTKLFNQELISNRSLNDEAELMKGKRERVVYWYSKEWAIMISEKIRKCGGNASFVTLY